MNNKKQCSRLDAVKLQYVMDLHRNLFSLIVAHALFTLITVHGSDGYP